MTITEIEIKAASVRAARNVLAADLSILNDELEAVKRQFMGRIKNGVNRLAASHAKLHEAIKSSPELFEKPRTQVFHGIKVGFRKGTGGVDWDDDEKVASLIKKHFPEQFDVLVKTTHKPQAKALDRLDVSDLKRIGCTVEGTGDVVVIKPTDSEVDKAVNALLKGAIDEAQKEAA
jgi:hypothetical protein